MRINSRGFTLVEAILTVVIIGGGLVGVMVLYQNATRSSMQSDVAIEAMYLAREKMEQTVATKVLSGYGAITGSLTESVSVGGRTFTRIRSIAEVSGTDLMTSQSGSGYKSVEVTVRWGNAATEQVTLKTILSN